MANENMLFYNQMHCNGPNNIWTTVFFLGFQFEFCSILTSNVIKTSALLRLSCVLTKIQKEYETRFISPPLSFFSLSPFHSYLVLQKSNPKNFIKIDQCNMNHEHRLCIVESLSSRWEEVKAKSHCSTTKSIFIICNSHASHVKVREQKQQRKKIFICLTWAHSCMFKFTL